MSFDYDQNSDALIGFAIQMAGAAGAYFRELRNQGFEEESAIELTVSYQESYIAGVAAATLAGPED